MKNFQLKLDVIGNNIANVNTVGFKKGRVTFKDQMYQAISGASAAAQGRGGINPKQVGLGSTVTTIDTIHTQGSTQSTSRALDLSLAGDGFFVVGSIIDGTLVQKDTSGGMGSNIIDGSIDDAMDLSYTRFGRFFIDEEGYLVNSDGLYLVGEAGQKVMPDPAEAAAAKSFTGPDGDLTTFISAVTAFNQSLSSATTVDEIQEAIQTFAGTTAQIGAGETISAGGAIGAFISDLETANDTGENSGFNAGMGNQLGNLKALAKELASISDAAETTGDEVAPDVEDLLKNIVPLMETPVNIIETAENAAHAATEPSYTTGLSFEAGLIQIPKSAKSFSIGSDGTISFIDARGQLKKAGQLLVASFPNNGGLQKSGDNLYKATTNSGSPDADGNGLQLNELGRPGSGVYGAVAAGTLEMSNVDLAEEFSEMIIAQRGFQANTRIITTADEILQELVNLKR